MRMNRDLPKGEWRDFTAAELSALQSMVGESKKTVDGAE